MHGYRLCTWCNSKCVFIWCSYSHFPGLSGILFQQLMMRPSGKSTCSSYSFFFTMACSMKSVLRSCQTLLFHLKRQLHISFAISCSIRQNPHWGGLIFQVHFGRKMKFQHVTCILLCGILIAFKTALRSRNNTSSRNESVQYFALLKRSWKTMEIKLVHNFINGCLSKICFHTGFQYLIIKRVLIYDFGGHVEMSDTGGYMLLRIFIQIFSEEIKEYVCKSSCSEGGLVTPLNPWRPFSRPSSL